MGNTSHNVSRILTRGSRGAGLIPPEVETGYSFSVLWCNRSVPSVQSGTGLLNQSYIQQEVCLLSQSAGSRIASAQVHLHARAADAHHDRARGLRRAQGDALALLDAASHLCSPLAARGLRLRRRPLHRLGDFVKRGGILHRVALRCWRHHHPAQLRACRQ